MSVISSRKGFSFPHLGERGHVGDVAVEADEGGQRVPELREVGRAEAVGVQEGQG